MRLSTSPEYPAKPAVSRDGEPSPVASCRLPIHLSESCRLGALVWGIIGSAAPFSAGEVLATLNPVPVVPLFGGPMLASVGLATGHATAGRLQLALGLRLARELAPAPPEQFVRHAAFEEMIPTAAACQSARLPHFLN
jgi:hypothetical protein